MSVKKRIISIIAIFLAAILAATIALPSQALGGNKDRYKVRLVVTGEGSLEFRGTGNSESAYFEKGQSVEVSHFPDESTYVSSVAVMADDGSAVEYAYNKNDTGIHFEMPSQDVIVSYCFEEKQEVATNRKENKDGDLYPSDQDTKTYPKQSGELNEATSGLQERILALPDIQEYTEMGESQKASAKEEMVSLYHEYQSLSEKDKRRVDCSRLYSSYLFSESMAYLPSEVHIDKVDPPETKKLDDAGKEVFAEKLNGLPRLHEVCDVNSIVVDEYGELTGNHICYTDDGEETFLTHEEMDELFHEVLELAKQYITLDPDQAKGFDFTKLQPLMYYFTSGVASYERDAVSTPGKLAKVLGVIETKAASVGKIVSYYTANYYGNLTNKHPKGGVYTVNTAATGYQNRPAFCMASQKPTPGGSGTDIIWEAPYNNNVVKVILYYGYGGPGEIVSHNNDGYLETHFAIDWAVNNSSANRNLAKAAYDKLYTNVDKSVANNVTAYEAGTSSATAQHLVYAVSYQSYENPIYVKTNYTAREAISPYFDIHIEKTDAYTGEDVQGAEFTVYMDGNEVAKVYSGADGKAAYHWRGNPLYTGYRTSSNKYYVPNYDKVSPANQSAINANGGYYRNHSDAYWAAFNESVAQARSDKTTLQNNTWHTWKVIESDTPETYEKNDKVWEQSFTVNTTAVEIDFTNVPNTAPVKVKKSSGNTDLTAENPLYSLEGAKYAVYESEEDAKNDKNRLEVLTTDKTGTTEEIQCIKGHTYYFKEIEASPGYLLCNGSDGSAGGIHEIYIEKAQEDYVVECTEPPANDPFNLTLKKLDLDTGESIRGTASTEGAIFEVTYYTNLDGNTDGDPERTWYFKTDEDGYFRCQDENFYVDSFSTSEGVEYESDELYRDTTQNRIIYPIGTYKIKEVLPPAYYKLEGNMNFVDDPGKKVDVTEGLSVVIKQDENGKTPQIYHGDNITTGAIDANNLLIYSRDEITLGEITINKRKADNTESALAGVTFQVKGLEEDDVYTVTTDAEGRAVFENLIPQNYVITEIKTQDGYSLLKDNVEVRLPVEMTLDEIRKTGADINQAVYDEATGKYCFYNLTYTVSDSAVLSMPYTGGTETQLYIILGAGIATVVSGLGIMFFKKKKHN